MRDLGMRGPRGILAWQAVTSATGIFMATALLALYLTGPAGLSDLSAALTLTGSAGLALIATPPASWAIRTLNPRRFAVLSCASRGVLFMALPLSTHHAWTIGIVLAIGFCEAAAFSVYQLIIADAVGEVERTAVLAVRRTLGNVGFTLGGLGVAIVVETGSRSAYMIAFITCGLALIAAAFIILRLPNSPESTSSHSDERVNVLVALKDLRFVALIAAATVTASSLYLLTVGVPLLVVRLTNIPNWLVGTLLILNTVLVVMFQVRLSGSSTTWSGARRAVAKGGALFAIAALLIAASAHLTTWAAVAALIVATVLAAIAEMWDSAGWWTISYQYAKPHRRVNYLATFDLVSPLVSIAGPPAVILIVVLGAFGWIGYGLVFLAASVVVLFLTARDDPGAASRSDS